MSLPTSRHEWLRRVSDYHSGSVSDAERAAVEAHLATCQECQEALAMYRRFYSLLRSPLRLGPPSFNLDEDTLIPGGMSEAPFYSQPPRQPRRSRVFAGIAAVLAATLVIVGFVAVYASRAGHPIVSATATPPHNVVTTAVPAASPTATAAATTQPADFICANAAGANLNYVYQRGDGHLYMVTGCAQPVKIPVGAYSSPLAWSPTNRYLAIQSASSDNTTFPLVIYDTASGSLITTRFDGQPSQSAKPGDVVRTFLGWVDDQTFLGAVQPVTGTNPNAPFGTSTIVKVHVATDLVSQTETTVGSIAWFADTKIIAPGYLFYGGLQNMNEGQAYLHRLNLNDGADTKLVPLGEYGNGGCQGTPFCNWTAPWDVTPDGVNVMYHSPGPTSMPSDTNVVKDTPLVFSRLDGTIKSTPFGTGVTDSLSKPSFSPQGKYVVATGATDRQVQQGDQWFRLLQIGAAATDVHGVFLSWRGDNLALVIEASGSPQPELYDIGSKTTRPLEPNSNFYLWGH